MRHKKDIFVTLSVLALAPFVAENPVEAQSVNCVQPLIFGSFFPCASAGTVTVRPDGTRAVGGCLTAGGIPFSNARCVVTQGFPFKNVQISVTAASVNISAGTNKMTVSNFNLITNGGGAATTISPGVPFINVPIGADLGIGASQAGGTYTGTFGIIVNLL